MTSTLVLRGNPLIALLFVEAAVRRLTLLPEVNIVDEAAADCVADNKSDLMKPSVPLCLTLDQSL